ncbi:conserved hypothetical protein [Streptomyces scabiei 87.22]|uniref:Uncharacterized protein n=1 Tax=Streptomyces scabiei (strain 87.22) TaxID=680198 RepID=C9Z941_STRSW|nr:MULTISPECIES: hypothetical protein [Streptomyces]MDX2652120.1 hypothetical protein [Streptomyces scabiei]MDX2725854.1 hypothetical protein [Streptomyces scabiei]MDX2863973.1 hypothetical protein [Streptomyces scabiei]MDX2881897.1 hypothetical protein [Streptomyces scabiei]MDX2892667.1 hypothetical protein [Streptomyces scabiei]
MTTAPERLSAVQLAEAYYVAQSRLARRTADRVQDLWRELDRRDLTGSWEALVGPRIVEAVAVGQFAAATQADPYLNAIEAADGSEPDGTRLRAAAFAGHASDGRSLESLLYLPVISTKQAIGAGLDDVEAMMRGLNQLLKMAATQVADAGRTAVGAGIAGRRTIQGYIRIAAAPCCARCAILSGKEFGWNAGFQRHPRCDCIHMPATLIARSSLRRGFLERREMAPTVGRGGPRGFVDAQTYFGSLSRREQDRIFTIAGARAIRAGADITSVVNARRGMYTASAFGRRVRATREGTTTRGAFYRSERTRAIRRGQVPADIGRQFRLRTPRLMPEEIFRLAESRDEAIRMLRRFGYIDG